MTKGKQTFTETTCFIGAEMEFVVNKFMSVSQNILTSQLLSYKAAVLPKFAKKSTANTH